ncbi:MAG TPA: energy transducer TonB [Acidobacteriaceae bacterium]
MSLLIFVLTTIGLAATLQGETARAGSLASTVPPAYPLAAKAAGIEGKVVIRATIGADGKVRSLRVVNGPTELRQAAIDAVLRWEYHPTIFRGVPVEVDTTVTVVFTMGSKKEKAAAEAAAQKELAEAAAKKSEQLSSSSPAAKN